MTGIALRAERLRKSFGDAHIIKSLSLEVRKGERHVIIGPNGAGKTTFFGLLSGLLQPSGGTISLGNTPISGLPPERINRMGLARSFQITSVFPRLPVFENVRIGVLAAMGYRAVLWRFVDRMKRVNERSWEILRLTGLTDVAAMPAGGLPYSQQRALEIGLTISSEPDVILLDEPTAGMSRAETETAIRLIHDVTAGRTLVMVEHDMSVVFSLADRVSVLVDGAVLATGLPDEIKRNAEVQKAYVGMEVP